MRSWLSSARARCSPSVAARASFSMLMQLFRQVPGERCAVPAGHARRAMRSPVRAETGPGTATAPARTVHAGGPSSARARTGECGDARGVPLGDVHPMLANPLQPSVGRAAPRACGCSRARRPAMPNCSRPPAGAPGGDRRWRSRVRSRHRPGFDQAAHEGRGGRGRDAEPLAQLCTRGRRSRRSVRVPGSPHRSCARPAGAEPPGVGGGEAWGPMEAPDVRGWTGVTLCSDGRRDCDHNAITTAVSG